MHKMDIYSKSGKMRRSPLNYPDTVECAYDAMFYILGPPDCGTPCI